MTAPKVQAILGRDGKPMYELVATAFEKDAFIHKPVPGNRALLRVGFVSPVPPRHMDNADYIHDSRPIKWPLYHPYYITAMADDANVVMAYVDDLEEVTEFWPEALDIMVFDANVTHYRFNANFPEPSWLKEVQATDFVPPVPITGAYQIKNVEEDLTIIGFSDNVHYDIQLNSHQLEYGVHPHEQFQQKFESFNGLEVTIYPTKDLEGARRYAAALVEFENTAEGSLPTHLLI